VAAGQDGRRIEPLPRFRPLGLRTEPALEPGAREEPLPAELRRRHTPRAGEVIEGALGQAQEGGGFAKGQDIRHMAAENGICWSLVKARAD
jgi:hypothetical protein